MNIAEKKFKQLKIDREVNEHNEDSKFREGYVKAINDAINVVKDLNLLPTSLTVENGAKNLLCGEINETIEIANNEYCDCGECNTCNNDDNNEYYMQKVPVKWTTIKDMYSKIVNFYNS